MQAYLDGVVVAIGKGPIGVFLFFTAFMVAAFFFFKKRGST